jgi:hypothetical protein
LVIGIFGSEEEGDRCSTRLNGNNLKMNPFSGTVHGGDVCLVVARSYLHAYEVISERTRINLKEFRKKMSSGEAWDSKSPLELDGSRGGMLGMFRDAGGTKLANGERRGTKTDGGFTMGGMGGMMKIAHAVTHVHSTMPVVNSSTIDRKKEMISLHRGDHPSSQAIHKSGSLKKKHSTEKSTRALKERSSEGQRQLRLEAMEKRPLEKEPSLAVMQAVLDYDRHYKNEDNDEAALYYESHKHDVTNKADSSSDYTKLLGVASSLNHSTEECKRLNERLLRMLQTLCTVESVGSPLPQRENQALGRMATKLSSQLRRERLRLQRLAEKNASAGASAGGSRDGGGMSFLAAAAEKENAQVEEVEEGNAEGGKIVESAEDADKDEDEDGENSKEEEDEDEEERRADGSTTAEPKLIRPLVDKPSSHRTNQRPADLMLTNHILVTGTAQKGEFPRLIQYLRSIYCKNDWAKEVSRRGPRYSDCTARATERLVCPPERPRSMPLVVLLQPQPLALDDWAAIAELVPSVSRLHTEITKAVAAGTSTAPSVDVIRAMDDAQKGVFMLEVGVLFVQGSPIFANDLNKAGASQAQRTIVLSNPDAFDHLQHRACTDMLGVDHAKVAMAVSLEGGSADDSQSNHRKANGRRQQDFPSNQTLLCVEGLQSQWHQIREDLALEHEEKKREMNSPEPVKHRSVGHKTNLPQRVRSGTLTQKAKAQAKARWQQLKALPVLLRLKPHSNTHSFQLGSEYTHGAHSLSLTNTHGATNSCVEVIHCENARFIRPADMASSDPSAADEEDYYKTAFVFTPVFAAGRVYTHQVLDALLSHSFFNGYVVEIITRLAKGHNDADEEEAEEDEELSWGHSTRVRSRSQLTREQKEWQQKYKDQKQQIKTRQKKERQKKERARVESARVADAAAAGTAVDTKRQPRKLNSVEEKAPAGVMQGGELDELDRLAGVNAEVAEEYNSDSDGDDSDASDSGSLGDKNSDGEVVAEGNEEARKTSSGGSRGEGGDDSDLTAESLGPLGEREARERRSSIGPLGEREARAVMEQRQHLVRFSLPKNWPLDDTERGCYGYLVQYLIGRYKVLPIGLYRAGPRRKTEGGPTERLQGAGAPLPYVFTCPGTHVLLNSDDCVFAIGNRPPPAGYCYTVEDEFSRETGSIPSMKTSFGPDSDTPSGMDPSDTPSGMDPDTELITNPMVVHPASYKQVV